ncbi:hypothetical protein E2C01_038556 [Portunus trituberculatus]|uniref:Uncharacterized protein n=1 Tax=Portunus trituberculatus TaxID=210409 RepID=A0A5B7FH50_PORTR|nr:hypothetical protein [Portunus trituberculatus]
MKSLVLSWSFLGTINKHDRKTFLDPRFITSLSSATPGDGEGQMVTTFDDSGGQRSSDCLGHGQLSSCWITRATNRVLTRSGSSTRGIQGQWPQIAFSLLLTYCLLRLSDTARINGRTLDLTPGN